MEQDTSAVLHGNTDRLPALKVAEALHSAQVLQT